MLHTWHVHPGEDWVLGNVVVGATGVEVQFHKVLVVREIVVEPGFCHLVLLEALVAIDDVEVRGLCRLLVSVL